MTITMYQSDRNFVTPANDASLYAALSGDTSGVLRRGNSLNLSINGLTVTVQTGQAVVLGRLIEVTSPYTFTLPGNSSGNIVIMVDLSKANSVVGQAGQPNYDVTVNQVSITGIVGNLVQEDINNGGYIYQLPIGTFTTTATSGTIKQRNPILNDTGWLNMDMSQTHAQLVGNPSYAQYRVRDNVVFLRWRGVNVLNASNGNQIARVPWSIRPDVEFAGAMTNIDDSGVTPATAFINDTTTLWARYDNNHGGSLFGTLSYPI